MDAGRASVMGPNTVAFTAHRLELPGTTHTIRAARFSAGIVRVPRIVGVGGVRCNVSNPIQFSCLHRPNIVRECSTGVNHFAVIKMPRLRWCKGFSTFIGPGKPLKGGCSFFNSCIPCFLFCVGTPHDQQQPTAFQFCQDRLTN